MPGPLFRLLGLLAKALAAHLFQGFLEPQVHSLLARGGVQAGVVNAPRSGSQPISDGELVCQRLGSLAPQ